MKQEDIYYRAGGQIAHAGCEILEGGRDTDFIIDHIEFKDHEKINGRTENGVWLMYLTRNGKSELPLVLNVTNRKRLLKLFPECEGFPARIKNKPVTMTKELTRDPNGGGQTYGIRVSPVPAKMPAPAEKIKCGEDMIDTVVAWAKENGKAIDDLVVIYEMTETVKNAIIDALNG